MRVQTSTANESTETAIRWRAVIEELISRERDANEAESFDQLVVQLRQAIARNHTAEYHQNAAETT